MLLYIYIYIYKLVTILLKSYIDCNTGIYWVGGETQVNLPAPPARGLHTVHKKHVWPVPPSSMAMAMANL